MGSLVSKPCENSVVACEHQQKQIDAEVGEVLAANCAELLEDCAQGPLRYFVSFQADEDGGPTVHISPSCKRHLRACRKFAESWNQDNSWFGLRGRA